MKPVEWDNLGEFPDCQALHQAMIAHDCVAELYTRDGEQEWLLHIKTPFSSRVIGTRRVSIDAAKRVAENQIKKALARAHSDATNLAREIGRVLHPEWLATFPPLPRIILPGYGDKVAPISARSAKGGAK